MKGNPKANRQPQQRAIQQQSRIVSKNSAAAAATTAAAEREENEGCCGFLLYLLYIGRFPIYALLHGKRFSRDFRKDLYLSFYLQTYYRAAEVV